ncbi:MAG: ribosomal protein L7/L12 [Planctomycetaceae bacterium]|nr:ribosomal protein L7/L12 [Planctomycetaceae bacterium]
MAPNRYSIEGFFDELELKYFSRQDDGDSNWVLLFPDGCLHIRLTANSEVVIFRTSGMARLHLFTKSQQNRLLRQLLKRNNELLVGHYSVDREIVFETTLPIHDSDLSAAQFGHCLSAMISEISYFSKSVSTMIKSAPSEAGVKEVMRQLMDEVESIAETPSTTKSHEVAPPTEAISDDDGFQVVLTSIGSSKLEVVKVVKHCRQISLLDSKRIVESVPVPIGRWQTRPEAEAIVHELKSAGATAVII